ncbi:MAG: acylphosphatase [Thermodesulfobacteriota bacterium]|nr:acylphosphatase [Thermodesulfobacteriota bacterium]
MKALRLKIHGRVQGVWFRASTLKEADRLHCSGWVRNTSDGDVEVWMQGDEKAMDLLFEWCRHGPPGAHVTGVDVQDVHADGSLEGFDIRC